MDSHSRVHPRTLALLGLAPVVLLVLLVGGFEENVPDANSSSQIDITGTWLDTAGDGSQMTIALHQSGCQVDGSFVDWRGQAGTISGEVVGNRARLTYVWPGNYAVQNWATIGAGTMRGTFERPDGRRGTWTATLTGPATHIPDSPPQTKPINSKDPDPEPQPEPEPESTIWYSGLMDQSVWVSPWPDPSASYGATRRRAKEGNKGNEGS